MTIQLAMFKKHGLLLGAFIGALALPALTTLPVHAAGTDAMCEAGNSSHCWAANAPGGDIVTDSVSTSSVIVPREDAICGGSDVVTATCPFVTGSGLNAALKGHTIEDMYLFAYSSCADSTSLYAVVTGDCIGSHAAYVPVDNGQQFISIGASNLDYNNSHVANRPHYIAGVAGRNLALDAAGQTSITYTWKYQ